jgi:hypothetical protein
MSKSLHSPTPDPLALTPRRRRLRVLTGVVLLVVIVMVVYGMRDPFFTIPAGQIAATARRAMVVRAILILVYWTFCMFMGLSLIVIAWLDVRELRRNISAARRRTWLDTVGKRRDRRDRDQLT